MRDGLNSSILPGTSGATAGKGLPPRTHAIHAILYRSAVPLALEDIERRLAAWGYEGATVGVTRNHLRSLCAGWGRDKVIAAVQDDQGRYALTREGRGRLAAGPRMTYLLRCPACGQHYGGCGVEPHYRPPLSPAAVAELFPGYTPDAEPGAAADTAAR